MKLQLFFWVLLFISGMGPDLQAGEIYQWIDKDGVQHFTDGPPPPGAQIVEGLSETHSDEAPAYTVPTERENTGAVEGGEAPSEREDTGAVEGGKNAPSDREDYWRRRGWGNGPSERENTGAVEGGENAPTDREDTGGVEGGENAPSDRRLY